MASTLFEGLLKEQIRGDPDMAGMLAVYEGRPGGGHPAFFFQKSPQDTDRGWVRGCFPRIDFDVGNQYDPERKVSGTLTLNIWCNTECAFMPEDIEARVLELVSGTFYSEGVHETLCAVWNRSDSFVFEMPSNMGGNTAPEVFGITVVFDLLRFPDQRTCDPDPIEALMHWTRAQFPEVTVVGLDLPRGETGRTPVWKPTDRHPALYWRFEGATTTNRQSYAVTWYTGLFAAHLISATIPERNRWTKAITERLQLTGEVPLADGSPLFAKQIAVRHSADPLREGQILLTGDYGVLESKRRERTAQPLNNAVFSNLTMEVKADGNQGHT